MIDRAVKEYVGKPNLSEIIWILQSQDEQFQLLSYQQLRDWQDKTQTDKIVWSEETLHEVQKGFLPGGEQTWYNVFVSSLMNMYFRIITNSRNRKVTQS